MRVHFTDEAKAKLRAIHTHIAQDSPSRAQAMIERIIQCAQRLANLPHSGRPVPEFRLDTLREVLERPYRIIYRIQPDQIEVVTNALSSTAAGRPDLARAITLPANCAACDPA